MDNKDRAKALEDLKGRAGWKLIVEELSKQKKETDYPLLEDMDPKLDEKVYTETKLLKIKRGMYQGLIDLPDTLINAETAVKQWPDYSKEL